MFLIKEKIKKTNIYLLLLIIGFFISIIFNFYTFLKIEIVNIKDLIKLILIPLVLFVLILINFLFKKQKNFYNLIFLVSIVSLFATEGYFHFFNKDFFINENYRYLNKQRELEIKRSKISFDRRSKFEVKKKNNNLKLYISPSNFLLDNLKVYPLSSYSNELNIHCNDIGEYSIYKSDRYGFNNNDIYWEKDVQNFLIGDSFVHGACVDQNQTISGNLNYYGYPSINLGMSNIGPLIEYAILQEYLPLNTNDSKKKLFWFWYEGNDYEDFNRELNNKILNKYLINYNFNQNLINENDMIAEYLLNKENNLIIEAKFDKYKKFFKLFYTRQLVKLLLNKHRSKNFKNLNHTPDFKNINKLISNISNLSLDKGYKLHFFYLPSYFRLIDNKYQIKKNFEKSKLKEVLNNEGIYFYDFTNDIINSKNPKKFFVFNYNTHYNKYAYNFFAKKIMSLINNNND